MGFWSKLRHGFHRVVGAVKRGWRKAKPWLKKAWHTGRTIAEVAGEIGVPHAGEVSEVMNNIEGAYKKKGILGVVKHLTHGDHPNNLGEVVGHAREMIGSKMMYHDEKARKRKNLDSGLTSYPLAPEEKKKRPPPIALPVKRKSETTSYPIQVI